MLVDENIGRLQISVHDSLQVHVLEGACYLATVLPDLLFREAHILLNSFLDNEFKISLLGPLDGNEELIELVVDEPVEVAHDIRMV
jgi:hypothetical protein